MSRPHDGHRAFFPFGNPFKVVRPKGKDSYLSAKLIGLQSNFEQALAERLLNLKPKEGSDISSISWMMNAITLLSETHRDIKSLITDLEFPVSNWDQLWVDIYLDNSVKLLDVCIAFSSELSRFEQCQLLLRYIVRVLGSASGSTSEEHLKTARGSLCDWKQQVDLRSPKLENSSSILQDLAGSLYLAKTKNSAKGKLLMRAMYSLKAFTVFICSVFSSALTGSAKLLMDFHVSEEFLWAHAFNELQAVVNSELRRRCSCGRVIVLNELEAVNKCVGQLYSLAVDHGSTQQKTTSSEQKTSSGVEDKLASLHECVSNLGQNAGRLSQGLDGLSKEVKDFFQIVLSGRDALLSNLRISDVMQVKNVGKCR